MEEQLRIYYDHYKETCSLSKIVQSHRNKCFVVLCILEAISFLLSINPDFICLLLNETAKKQLELTVYIGNSVLQTLIWILIAYILVRYVQDVLYIERHYVYIKCLELKIAKLLEETKGSIVFCRESGFYFKRYPMVLNLIDLFYKVFIPVLFTAINVMRIFQELHYGVVKINIICDIIIFLMIFIVTWFYFFSIHRTLTAWFMKCSIIKMINKKLTPYLKEV